MFFSNRLRRPLIWTLSATLLICGALVFHFTKHGWPRGYVGYSPDPAETLRPRATTTPARTKTESVFVKSAPVAEQRSQNQPVPAAIGAPPVTSQRSDQHDERDAQLDREARTLAAKLLAANAEEAVELRKQLESLIERHFEYRQQQRKQEIEQLSQRIDALRLSQVRRQENKAEVVKRRLNDLIDPTANLDWDTSDSTNGTVDEKRADSGHEQASVPKFQTMIGKAITTESSASVTAVQPGTPSQSVLAHSSAANATYQGRPISAWLFKLKTERDPNALLAAVNALQHLSADVDPRVLIRAIIQMAQSIGVRVPFDGSIRSPSGMGRPPVYSLVDDSIELLQSLPPSILVDELVQQLITNPSQDVTDTFQAISSGLIVATADTDQINRVVDAHQSKSARVTKGLAREFREHSQEVIDALVLLAKRNDALEDWVVDSSIRILSLNEEPLTKYPDLVPMVQRFFFNESNSLLMRGEAAVILGRSGMDSGQVLGFLQMALEQQSAGATQVSPLKNHPVVQKWLRRLAPRMPEVALLLKDQLAGQVEKIEGGYNSDSEIIECIRLLRRLVDLGELAAGALPSLRQLAEKPIDETPTPYGDLRDVAGKAIRPRPTLRDHFKDAIDQIEAAVGKSKAEPAVGNVVAPMGTLPGVTMGGKNSSDQSNATVPPREPTFDGRPYRAWLEILETERKPEMFAAAIDACSRLAQPKDRARIVRGILHAVSLFENGDSGEQARIWNAAFTGLNRLAGEVVLDVLIAAAKDNESPRIDRTVQFRIWDQLQSASFREAVKSRGDTIMTEFDDIPVGDQKEQDDLIALASCVWRLSDLLLDDLPGVKKRMIDLVDSGRGLSTDASYLAYASPWHVTVVNLVSRAPETPGLGLMIAKQARSRAEVVQILGRLGSAAEAVVPTLVDLFLEEQQSFLQQHQRGSFLTHANQDQYLNSIVSSLGSIGGDPKGYALLRELNLATLPDANTSDGAKISRMVVDALNRYTPPKSLAYVKQLLDDRVLINGIWTIRETKRHPELSGRVFVENQNWNYTDLFSPPPGSFSALPTRPPLGAGVHQWDFRHSDGITILEPPHSSDPSSNPDDGTRAFQYRTLSNFSVDVTSTPRQVNFIGTKGDGTEMRQFGIYELTETTLRVQLAPIGEARPTEFIEDEASLPQGHLLLELDRKLDNKHRPSR